MKEQARRRASRLILLDAEGRVLLFRHARRNGDSFWAPPGGGLEHEETFDEAALREASEELGVAGFPVKLLWRRITRFLHINRFVSQDECYFLIEGKLPEFSDNVRKVHEQEGILEMRWWTVDELESTGEAVFPEDLASELRKVSP